jgi:type IV pilus assembly protein PilY1
MRTYPCLPKALRRAVFMLLAAIALPSHSETMLADQPIFTKIDVPGNLALALSVEYPTAVSVAHADSTYSTQTAVPYLGYFDPDKCYDYVYVKDPSATNLSHFKPIGKATQRTCRGAWSGNFLNWATTQTIDPFRWALTGGYRVVDTKDLTIIEKAYASGQGGTQNFPNRTLYGTTLVAGATPWSANEFRMRIEGLGTRMRFAVGGDLTGKVEALTGTTNITGDQAKTVFEVYVRVKVCDESVGLESNCKRYPSGYWKPEGLIQKYADRIRLSAFGYLNDDNLMRDGGVLRARQKFVGPQISIPGRSSGTNPASEWDPDTGVFTLNPDKNDADATALLFGVPVGNSGVINYLNKFGASGSYKTYDPVGELYYAALRYFRNLGNVPAYYSAPKDAKDDTRKRWVDGFPVIADWDDPIQYTCQKNFILGIGDVNTHADKNVPGATSTATEPEKPDEVENDKTVDAVKATNQVGKMQGLGALASAMTYNGCCNNNSALMAGLAYEANTTDIRPDLDNPLTMPRGQSVKTYWLDVLEYLQYKPNNQFYLAAKYGGFQVPKDFQPYSSDAALEEKWWHNNSDMLADNQPRPDTYFTASRPDLVVQGLSSVFADIASQLRRDTTSFATPSARVPDSTGIASFSAKYNAEDWTGEVDAGLLKFTSTTDAEVDKKWSLTDKMETQFAGSGWSSDTSTTGGRRVVTWNTATERAVPFRYDALSAAQRSALDSPYRDGDDGADLLNYLRGDRSLEQLPGTSSRPYRYRPELLGDIAGSKLTVVGPPNRDLSMNKGYGAFKEKWKARSTIVYFGANDGMLHAINGSVIETTDANGKKSHEFGSDAGKEIFAYVPGQVFQGPNGTPGIDGLAALGNPSFTHHYYVNATPSSHDIDFAWTYKGETPDGKSPDELDPAPDPDWHTVLIGGLGKGGRSYYAIDVTDPASMTGESAVAGKVLWEFTDEDMGYTYGAPTVVKTDKYGWVVILPSGYNNKTGKGYFFIVHPVTGKLLEKVSTGEGSATQDAGLAHANAFAFSLSDGKTDAVYAGDLLGNVWRWDLRGKPRSYPAPVKFARLTDDKGNAQPITSRPMIEYSPLSKNRRVLLGTGRLLDTTDIVSSQQQSFYSLADGSAARFDTTGPFPRTRSDWTAVTDLSSGLSEPTNWYIDLGTEVVDEQGTVNAWRVTDPAVILREGATYASFAAVLPTGDACEPSGRSNVYAINVATGKSVLKEGRPYFSVSGMVIDMKLFLVDAKTRFLVGTDGGERKELELEPSSSVVTTTNWREIPVAD